MPSRQTKRKGIILHDAATAAAMPASLNPMLPIQVHKPFSDPDWLFEPKWDGWRTMCFLRDGKTHLVSRKRNSLSERFPELRDIANAIKADTAIIDGEIVALDQNGLPHFEGLRSRLHRTYSIVFYAFDLLYLDGFDLTELPPREAQGSSETDPAQRQHWFAYALLITSRAAGSDCLKSSKHCNSKEW